MMHRTVCPHCATPFSFEGEGSGGVIKCPNQQCGMPLRLRPRDAAPPPPPPPPPIELPRPPAMPYPYADNPAPQERPQPAPPPLPEEQTLVPEVILTSADKRRPRGPLQRILAIFFGTNNPTDASILLTGLMAAGATALLYYGLLKPFLREENYIRQLLEFRGWVPYVTVMFTFWAGAILLVKWLKLNLQKRVSSYPLLPGGKRAAIHPGNIDLLQAHLAKMPRWVRRCFLVSRVMHALEHFKVRKNVQEVGAVLTAQAEIDAVRVETSYTMLKVFIWAIPILGFVGTVVGISDAVGGFTGAVQSAEKIDEIKKALGTVTSGLAVAFDTTLLSLVLSIIIMFPANSMQKAEEDLLTSIDEYCHENLLRNLRDDTAPVETVAHPAPPPAPPPESTLVPAMKQLTEAIGLLMTELRTRSEPEARLAALRLQEQTLAQAMRDHLTLMASVGNQLLASMASQPQGNGTPAHKKEMSIEPLPAGLSTPERGRA
jgi:biopolymer transport protein ExbB/TolQ